MIATEACRADAVVLKKVAYRDADLIVTLFVEGHGKLSAIARGARRSRRRFAGALELFVVSNVVVSPPRRGELWSLTSADVVDSYADIAGDIAAFCHGNYAVELILELTGHAQPDDQILGLLRELYRELATQGAHVAVMRAFEIRLLDILGLAPVVEHCVQCRGGPDNEDWSWDVGRGGSVCSRCSSPGATTGRRRASAAARSLLLAGRRAPSLAAMTSHGVDPVAAGQARDMMLDSLHAHIGKPLRSVAFIEQLSASVRSKT